jgi:hypothetical protein
MSLGFSGYAAGSYPYNPGLIMSHPIFGLRMMATALDDAHRSQWQAFE